MANKQDIAKIVVMLSAAYPNWNPTKYTSEIYYQDLQDIDPHLLMISVKHCRTSTTRDQRFAPSAGEIRKSASEIQREKIGLPTAIEAWSELLHAPRTEQISKTTDEYDEEDRRIIEIYPYVWKHPIVREVVVMLGWPKFPDLNQESFERTTFLKVYDKELERYMFRQSAPAEVKEYISSGPAVKQLAGKLSK